MYLDAAPTVSKFLRFDQAFSSNEFLVSLKFLVVPITTSACSEFLF